MPQLRPLTQEEKDFLASKGYDVASLPEQMEVLSPEETRREQALDLIGDKASTGGAIGTTLKAHGGSLVGAGLGTAASLAALSWLAGPQVGLPVSLLVGAGGGLAGGYAGGKAQEAVLPASVQEPLQERAAAYQELYPKTTLATDLIGGAIAGGGRPSLRPPAYAVKGILQKMATPTGEMAAPYREAIRNVVTANALSTGINAGVQLGTRGEIDPTELAGSALTGAAFAQPSAWGRKIMPGWEPIAKVKSGVPVRGEAVTLESGNIENVEEIQARRKVAIEQANEIAKEQETFKRQAAEIEAQANAVYDAEQQKRAKLKQLFAENDWRNPQQIADAKVNAEFNRRFAAKIPKGAEPLEAAAIDNRNKALKKIPVEQKRQELWEQDYANYDPEGYNNYRQQQQQVAQQQAAKLAEMQRSVAEQNAAMAARQQAEQLAQEQALRVKQWKEMQQQVEAERQAAITAQKEAAFAKRQAELEAEKARLLAAKGAQVLTENQQRIINTEAIAEGMMTRPLKGQYQPAEEEPTPQRERLTPQLAGELGKWGYEAGLLDPNETIPHPSGGAARGMSPDPSDIGRRIVVLANTATSDTGYHELLHGVLRDLRRSGHGDLADQITKAGGIGEEGQVQKAGVEYQQALEQAGKATMGGRFRRYWGDVYASTATKMGSQDPATLRRALIAQATRNVSPEVSPIVQRASQFKGDKVANQFSQHRFSPKLEQEIKFVQDSFNESADEGETLSRNEAIRRLMEDSDMPDSVASEFRNELNDFAVKIGMYKEMSKRDLDNTQVTSGHKYDLKKGGKFYKFESWEPLEKGSYQPPKQSDYDSLVEKMKDPNTSDEEKQAVWQQIETLKNTNEGMPPAKQRSYTDLSDDEKATYGKLFTKFSDANQQHEQIGSSETENALIDAGQQLQQFERENNMVQFGETAKFQPPVEESGEQPAFLVNGIQLVKNPSKLWLDVDRHGVYNGDSLVGALRNRLSPAEYDIYKKAGIEEEFKGRRITPAEASGWMEQNGPKVEVHGYGMEGKVSEARREYDRMTHEWYDVAPKNAKLITRVLMESGQQLDAAWRTYAKAEDAPYKENALKYVRLKREIDAMPPDNSPRATSAYETVSAFNTNEPMPEWTTSKEGKNVQRVDVVIPVKEVTVGMDGRKMKEHPTWTQDNLHENLPNTLGWAMIQYKTGPKGEKIAFVTEAQSRWGQHAREYYQKFPENKGKETLGGGGKDHPLLRDYNRLILKAAIDQARKEGATHIVVSDAETAMITEGHDAHLQTRGEQIVGEENLRKRLRELYPTREEYDRNFRNEYTLARAEDQVTGELLDKWKLIKKGDTEPEQSAGMRLNYDTILPKIAEELTGSKGEKVSLGEHKNAFQSPATGRLPGEQPIKSPRENLIFRNPDGTPKTDVSGLIYPLERVPKRPPMLFGAKFQEPVATSKAVDAAVDNNWKTKVLRSVTGPHSLIEAEISKVGRASQPLAKAFTTFYEDMRQLKGELTNDVVGKLRQYVDFWSPKELFTLDNPDLQAVLQRRYDLIYDGDSKIKLTPTQQEIDAIVTQNNRDTLAAKSARAGLRATESPAPERYVPITPSKETLAILLDRPPSDPQRAKLIEDFYNHYETLLKGRKGWKDQASTKLREFLGGYSKQDIDLAQQFGPIDKPSGYTLPRSWVEGNSLLDVMSRFNNRYARRLAYHDAIESNPEVERLLKDPIAGVRNMDAVRNVYDDISGQLEYHEAKRQAFSGLVRAAMLGPLTGSKDFVSNLVLGFQHQSPSQAVTSAIHAWSNMRDNIAESFKAGVNRHNIGSLEFGEGDDNAVINLLRRSRDVLNEVQGRNWLEQMTRATAYGQGKWVAMDNLLNAKKGNISSQGKKFLDDFAPGWEQYKSSGEFPPDVLRQVASRYVESVQGTYDYRGLPALAQKGTLAPYLSLARWNIEKTNNFIKYNIEPFKQGNPLPLLMSTIGMFIGGEALTQLVEEFTKRKQRTPEWGELSAAKEQGADITKATMWKLAGYASLAGYMGMAGDLTKSLMDLSEKNKPQVYNNPLVIGLSSIGDNVWDIIEAAQSGDLELTTDLIGNFLEDTTQVYRLAQNNLSTLVGGEKAKDLQRAEKMRDVRVWKQVTGQPVASVGRERANPYIDADVKDFKRESDLGKAASELPALISKAFDKADGDIEKLRKELGKLKRNSYQTMPSFERTPLSFLRYLNYLNKSQGEEAATARLMDYLQQNAVDRAKAGAIPSL